MRSPGAVRGCVSIAVCQGLVWVPPCAVLSRGKQQRPRGSKSQDYFPKLFDLSRSNLAAFLSARSLFAAGFQHMFQKLIYSDLSACRAKLRVLVRWGGGRLRWHLGTVGCRVQSGWEQHSPLEVGEGQQKENDAAKENAF